MSATGTIPGLQNEHKKEKQQNSADKAAAAKERLENDIILNPLAQPEALQIATAPISTSSRAALQYQASSENRLNIELEQKKRAYPDEEEDFMHSLIARVGISKAQSIRVSIQEKIKNSTEEARRAGQGNSKEVIARLSKDIARQLKGNGAIKDLLIREASAPENKNKEEQALEEFIAAEIQLIQTQDSPRDLALVAQKEISDSQIRVELESERQIREDILKLKAAQKAPNGLAIIYEVFSKKSHEERDLLAKAYLKSEGVGLVESFACLDNKVPKTNQTLLRTFLEQDLSDNNGSVDQNLIGFFHASAKSLAGRRGEILADPKGINGEALTQIDNQIEEFRDLNRHILEDRPEFNEYLQYLMRAEEDRARLVEISKEAWIRGKNCRHKEGYNKDEGSRENSDLEFKRYLESHKDLFERHPEAYSALEKHYNSGYLHLDEVIRNAKACAAKFHDAMNGAGTDEALFDKALKGERSIADPVTGKKVVVSNTQYDLEWIRYIFHKEYGSSLENWVRWDFSFGEEQTRLSQIKGEGLSRKALNTGTQIVSLVVDDIIPVASSHQAALSLIENNQIRSEVLRLNQSLVSANPFSYATELFRGLGEEARQTLNQEIKHLCNDDLVNYSSKRFSPEVATLIKSAVENGEVALEDVKKALFRSYADYGEQKGKLLGAEAQSSADYLANLDDNFNNSYSEFIEKFIAEHAQKNPEGVKDLKQQLDLHRKKCQDKAQMQVIQDTVFALQKTIGICEGSPLESDKTRLVELHKRLDAYLNRQKNLFLSYPAFEEKVIEQGLQVRESGKTLIREVDQMAGRINGELTGWTWNSERERVKEEFRKLIGESRPSEGIGTGQFNEKLALLLQVYRERGNQEDWSMLDLESIIQYEYSGIDLDEITALYNGDLMRSFACGACKAMLKNDSQKLEKIIEEQIIAREKSPNDTAERDKFKGNFDGLIDQYINPHLEIVAQQASAYSGTYVESQRVANFDEAAQVLLSKDDAKVSKALMHGAKELAYLAKIHREGSRFNVDEVKLIKLIESVLKEKEHQLESEIDKIKRKYAKNKDSEKARLKIDREIVQLLKKEMDSFERYYAREYGDNLDEESRSKYSSSLRELLSRSLTGLEIEWSNALLEGDRVEADVKCIRYGKTQGDRELVSSVISLTQEIKNLDPNNPEDRKKIEEANQRRKEVVKKVEQQEGTSFEELAKEAFGGEIQGRIMKARAERGALSDAEQIAEYLYDPKWIGNQRSDAWHSLDGKTDQEINEIVSEFRELTKTKECPQGKDLKSEADRIYQGGYAQYVKSAYDIATNVAIPTAAISCIVLGQGSEKEEYFGEDHFEFCERMRGAPSSAEQIMQTAKRRIDFERSGIFSGTVDVFSSTGETMDSRYNKLQDFYEKAKKDGQVDQSELSQLTAMYDSFKTLSEEFRVAKNVVADGVATAGATVVVVAVSVGTAGAGAPVVVVIVTSSAASYATTTAIKQSIKGNALSNDERARDFGYAVVDGLTAAPGLIIGKFAGKATQGLISSEKIAYAVAREELRRAGKDIVEREVEELAAKYIASNSLKVAVVSSSAEGFTQSSLSSLITTSVQTDWKNGDFSENILANLQAAGIQGSIGAVTGGVMEVGGHYIGKAKNAVYDKTKKIFSGSGTTALNAEPAHLEAQIEIPTAEVHVPNPETKLETLPSSPTDEVPVEIKVKKKAENPSFERQVENIDKAFERTEAQLDALQDRITNRGTVEAPKPDATKHAPASSLEVQSRSTTEQYFSLKEEIDNLKSIVNDVTNFEGYRAWAEKQIAIKLEQVEALWKTLNPTEFGTSTKKSDSVDISETVDRIDSKFKELEERFAAFEKTSKPLSKNTKQEQIQSSEPDLITSLAEKKALREKIDTFDISPSYQPEKVYQREPSELELAPKKETNTKSYIAVMDREPVELIKLRYNEEGVPFVDVIGKTPEVKADDAYQRLKDKYGLGEDLDYVSNSHSPDNAPLTKPELMSMSAEKEVLTLELEEPRFSLDDIIDNTPSGPQLDAAREAWVNSRRLDNILNGEGRSISSISDLQIELLHKVQAREILELELETAKRSLDSKADLLTSILEKTELGNIEAKLKGLDDQIFDLRSELNSLDPSNAPDPRDLLKQNQIQEEPKYDFIGYDPSESYASNYYDDAEAMHASDTTVAVKSDEKLDLNKSITLQIDSPQIAQPNRALVKESAQASITSSQIEEPRQAAKVAMNSEVRTIVEPEVVFRSKPVTESSQSSILKTEPSNDLKLENKPRIKFQPKSHIQNYTQLHTQTVQLRKSRKRKRLEIELPEFGPVESNNVNNKIVSPTYAPIYGGWDLDHVDLETEICHDKFHDIPSSFLVNRGRCPHCNRR